MKKIISLCFFVISILISFNIEAQIQKNRGTVSFQSKNYIKQSKDLIFGQGMFIPDGPACPSICLEDSIIVTGFPQGITIDTITDIQSICLNIEHSYSGDLGFSLICPNGQMVVLSPNTHAGGAFFGQPNETDGADACDSTVNLPGNGWTYCWSEIYPNHGTAGSLASGGISPIDSTSIYGNSNYILPNNSIVTSLMGCPLNGTWILRVCDDFASDNGWLFGWEVAYNGHNNIAGNVFLDGNNNGIHDTLEANLAHQLIKIEPGPYYKNTNIDGNFTFSRDTGNYTISCIPPTYWSITTDSLNYHFYLSNPNILNSSFEFGIKPIPNITDVGVYCDGHQTRPNHYENYWLNYKNIGTNTQQGTLHLQYDPLLTFNSSIPLPDSQNGNILEWNYNTLQMQENRSINLYFLMPGLSNLGDTIVSTCWINPIAGDSNIINNYDTLTQVISAPFDPNSKTVFPKGNGVEGYVNHGQELTYTIHFQNTGNTVAQNVILKDTIDTDMNVGTFTYLASSHQMTYEINGTGIITFSFNNIWLPDSSNGELESQGFVSYSIKPNAGLTDYTEVINKASIFFDDNPPIFTNPVLNTYVLNTVEITEIINNKIKIVVFPNPFLNFTKVILPNPLSSGLISIYDILGKEVKRLVNLNGKEIIIQKENLKTGMYFFRIEDKNGIVGNGKMVVE